MRACVLYSQNWWWWFLFISFVDVFALTLVEYIFISRGCAGERERERKRVYYYLLFSVYVYKYIYHSFALLFLSVLDCCYSYFGDWLFFCTSLFSCINRMPIFQCMIKHKHQIKRVLCARVCVSVCILVNIACYSTNYAVIVFQAKNNEQWAIQNL